MKWVFYFLTLTIGGCEIMAISVPNNNTFALTDVVAAIEDHAGEIPGDDSLQGSFQYAIDTYFDPEYNNNSYAPDNSMRRFRNYGPDNENKALLIPEGFSPNGDGVHDYFVVYNLEYYPLHKMMIFNTSENLIYQKENDYHLYPWDGKVGGVLQPAGSYIWVLEIDGKTYANGIVIMGY